jgi:Fe2+ or Zn2+ uptake regulation protein
MSIYHAKAKAGQLTKKCQLVLDFVNQLSQPSSTMEIHLKLKHAGAQVSLATTGRALRTLESLGAICSTTVNRERKFLKKGLGDTHMGECTSCGVNLTIDCACQENLLRTASEHKFVMSSHHFYFFGLCESCR